jgi:DNA polymerase I-like protein with 3'-5' exonuclease and polymerase domains
MAGCQTMLDMVAKGADIHGEVAHQLFGCDSSQPCWFEHRQIGKRGDFAFIFDVGAETFQATLAKLADIYLELPECQTIVNDWRALYPEYKRAVYRDHKLAEKKGWLRLANGRIRWFAAWEDFHKAFNQRVQGSLAELMKDWMIQVEDRWPGTLVLTIHDSLVMETRHFGAVKLAARLGESIGTRMLGVPMQVEVKPWQ